MLLRSLLMLLVLVVAGCAGFPPKRVAREPAHVAVQPTVAPAREIEPTEKPQIPAARHAELDLARGVKNYENGEYKTAAIDFQNALTGGLVATVDQVTAHKFLAFIYCVSKEKMACRGEFKEILTLNPKFELTPAEAGHPIWGPVFREVRAETLAKKKRKK